MYELRESRPGLSPWSLKDQLNCLPDQYRIVVRLINYDVVALNSANKAVPTSIKNVSSRT